MTQKEAVEQLLKSYRIGGMPLVLVIVGFLISTVGALAEGKADGLEGVGPALIFVMGSVFVLFGGLLWVVETYVKFTLHAGFITVADRLIEAAGRVATDGGNLKTALEQTLPELSKVTSMMVAGEATEEG